jgi:hypothetical protein
MDINQLIDKWQDQKLLKPVDLPVSGKGQSIIEAIQEDYGEGIGQTTFVFWKAKRNIFKALNILVDNTKVENDFK